MLICHGNADFQAHGQSDDYDWSTSSTTYPNLEEFPTFITRNHQSTLQRSFTTADPQHLVGKQLEVYTFVKEHLESANPHPFHLIVSGTAGTGKSYLIHCLQLLLGDKVRVAAPTGVAAFNVDGNTLHSLLSLPTKGEFKDLNGEHLHNLRSLFRVGVTILSPLARLTDNRGDLLGVAAASAAILTFRVSARAGYK